MKSKAPKIFPMVLLLLYLTSECTLAQPSAELPDQLKQARTFEQKDDALNRATELLSKSSDPDLLQAVALVELERERLRLQHDPLDSLLKEMSEAPEGPSRNLLLRELRLKLLERGAYISRLLSKEGRTLEDNRRILDYGKSLLQAADDLADPSLLGGEERNLTRGVKMISGIIRVAEGVNDQSASDLVSGLRDINDTLTRRIRHLGVRPPANSTLALDIPAAVAAAQLDVTRRAYDQTTETLKQVEEAIAGDPDAVRRAIESSRGLEDTLSGETFGRAILDAMADRLIERVPFLRTVFNTSEQRSAASWLVGTCVAESGTAIRFVEESDKTVTGYIAELGEYSRENYKYRVGEQIFRNWHHQAKSTDIWSHAVCDGEVLWANSTYREATEDKYWCKTGVIKIDVGQTHLEVPGGHGLGYRFVKR